MNTNMTTRKVTSTVNTASYIADGPRNWMSLSGNNIVLVEKLFIDYAGHTVPIINPTTGKSTEAQIFLATFGASCYTYVEASTIAGTALLDQITHPRL